MSQAGSFLKRYMDMDWYGLFSFAVWDSETQNRDEIIDMIDEPLHVHSIKEVLCEGQSGATNIPAERLGFFKTN